MLTASQRLKAGWGSVKMTWLTASRSPLGAVTSSSRSCGVTYFPFVVPWLNARWRPSASQEKLTNCTPPVPLSAQTSSFAVQVRDSAPDDTE